MPGNVSEGERKTYLEDYAALLKGIHKAVPLFFHPREDYGGNQRLKPGVMARSGFQWNPRAGQTHDLT
jgi:NAD(P)H dehydrogenase (quinone)